VATVGGVGGFGIGSGIGKIPEYPVQFGFHGEDKMPKPEIEEFAKILIEKVRDAAIQSSDRVFGEEYVVSKRWKEAAAKGTPEAFARVLIPDIVDDTLFYLLHAIDSGAMRISFVASNGNVVDLTEEGMAELAGWLGGDGWISKYSEQRFINDVEDLKGFFKEKQ
jgi:hypothetical protein